MMENEVEDIGTQLKAKRERLGYSLQDVAQNTCIRRTHLESLEKNQFSDLPGRAYVIGFVKAYARHLGMDTDPLLVQLEEILSIDEPKSLKPISSVMQHPERLGNSSSGAGWGRLLLWAIALIVLGAAIFFLSPMFRDQNPAAKVSSQPMPVKVIEKDPVDTDEMKSETLPSQESLNSHIVVETTTEVEPTITGQGAVTPSQKE